MDNIMLKEVRLSFPSVFKKAVFHGVVGKFEATFLFPKTDVDNKKLVDDAITEALTSSKITVPKNSRFLKDGDDNDSDYNGYAGNWSVKASNHVRPTLINRDRAPIAEDDDILYAGCYVNAIIDVWVQDNKYGRRLNANLHGIQFVKKGESFGMCNADHTEEFDVLVEDEAMSKESSTSFA